MMNFHLTFIGIFRVNLAALINYFYLECCVIFEVVFFMNLLYCRKRMRSFERVQTHAVPIKGDKHATYSAAMYSYAVNAFLE